MGFALERVWPRLNAELFRAVGADRYACWIRHVRPVSLDEDEIVLSVAGAYEKHKVETMLGDALLESARKATNRNVDIILSVEPGAPGTPSGSASFETFIVSRTNRLAARAMRRFAEGQERTLILTGPSASGKTHLLRAAARELTRRRVAPVLLLTGREFIRQQQIVRTGRHEEGFRKKFRSSAAVLLDDFDSLCGRPEAQSAWLQIYLALVERGKQVALTCTKPPKNLEGVTRACRMRLRAGTEARLDPPDAALTRLILSAVSPSLMADALDVVVTETGGRLQDALEVLRASPGPLTVARARAAARSLRARWPDRPSLGDIARVAADGFQVPIVDLYSDKRSAAQARQACWYLARKILLEPYTTIGRHFGGRNHSTVLLAIRRLERDADLLDRVDKLEQALRP